MSTQVETLYRAKKIDSDEWAIGHIFIDHTMTSTIQDKVTLLDYHINPSTLAIPFTNSGMEDSEGTPIFASLSSDGNGGDYELLHGIKWIVKFHRLSLRVVSENKNMEHYLEKTHFKVTGIYTTDKE